MPNREPRAHAAECGVAKPNVRPWARALVLGLVVAAAAAFRLSGLDLAEFKRDEAVACWLARGIAAGQCLPAHGLKSSVEVRNPPAFVYLLALPSLLSSDPRWLTCFVGLLNVAAVALCMKMGSDFFGRRVGLVCALAWAVSPWGVIYSRKIWAQNLLPPLCTALLYALLQVVVRGNRRYTFPLVFLALLAPQIHFSGLCATLAALCLVAVYRPRLAWRSAACACLAAVVVLAPYLRFQWATRFADVRGAVRVASEGSARGGRARRTLDAAGHLLNISGAGRIESLLGRSTKAFDRSCLGARRGHWLLVGLLALGLAVGAGMALGRRAPGGRAAIAVVVWLLAPIAVYGATGIRTCPHYLAVAYPAPFLVMGWAAAPCLRRGCAWLPPLRALAFSLLAAGSLTATVVNTRLLGFVQDHGAVAGDYGAAYKHKHAAARAIARAAGKGELRVGHDPQGRRPLRFEYWYMLRLLGAGAAKAPGPGVEFVIAERYRDGLSVADMRALARSRYQDFGPVRVYAVAGRVEGKPLGRSR